MKLKLKILLALAAVACSAVFSGCSEVRKPSPLQQSLDRIVDESFETGVRLGYACGVRGGTTNDAEMIIKAKREHQPEKVQQWFQSH